MKNNLGTAWSISKDGEKVELAIKSYLRAEYTDHRLISLAQLEDNSYVLSVENPQSTGRAPSQNMRLSPESLIGLLSTSMLYFDSMGVSLEDLLKQAVKESGDIDFSFDKLENYSDADIPEAAQPTDDSEWKTGEWAWSESSKTMLSFITELVQGGKKAYIDNQDGIQGVWAVDIMVKPTEDEIFNALSAIAEKKYPVGTKVKLLYSDVCELIESENFIYSNGKLYADGGRLAVWESGRWAEVIKDTPEVWDVTVEEFKMVDGDGAFTIMIKQGGLTNPPAQEIADKIKDFLNK